jgi:hypothetical protein
MIRNFVLNWTLRLMFVAVVYLWLSLDGLSMFLLRM